MKTLTTTVDDNIMQISQMYNDRNCMGVNTLKKAFAENGIEVKEDEIIRWGDSFGGVYPNKEGNKQGDEIDKILDIQSFGEDGELKDMMDAVAGDVVTFKLREGYQPELDKTR